MPVPADELRGARAVAGLLGDEQFAGEAAQVKALPPHADLDDGEIVDFLYRVGIERVGGGGRSKVFSVENLGELAWSAHELFNVGLGASEEWPTAFYDALDAIAARINRRGPRWVARMAVVRWLDGLHDGHGAAIRAAVAEYREGRLGRVQSVIAEDGGSPTSESLESSECGDLPDQSSTG